MREFRLWTARCRRIVVLAAGFLPVDREWIVICDDVKPGEIWDRSEGFKVAKRMVDSVALMFELFNLLYTGSVELPTSQRRPRCIR